MAGGWSARLQLEYALRQGRTTLVRRRHSGPLQVQKALYPEGSGVCHTVVLHPPGGVAGGDTLRIESSLSAGSHTLITTPGAAKWYRSGGRPSRQTVRLSVADGAVLEWLPQETILFDGAHAEISTRVDLEGSASFLGWEITCLGRTASGERFREGTWRQGTEIRRDGTLVWGEYGLLEGDDPLLRSPVGLAGHPVSATLVAAGLNLSQELLEACRVPRLEEQCPDRCGITLLPGILVARYLGDSSQRARAYFGDLWGVLRPFLTGKNASPPRIWNT